MEKQIEPRLKNIETYLKIEPRLRKNDGFMAMVCAFSGNDLLEEIVVYI